MNSLDVALICRSLSEANRLQIVEMLALGEKCACELLEAFEITQPTLSYHMRNLVECGLVNYRKEGKWNYYAINCETLQAFKSYINSLSCTVKDRTHSCG